MSLKEELGFRQDFHTPGHEALLNVYYTANLLKKRAGDYFRHHKVTDVQYNVLVLIKYQGAETNGLTQVELSRMLLVNRGNVTTLIDRMEKAGLVARTPVAEDRRCNLIQLTDKGRRMVDRVEAGYVAEVKRLTECLSEEEQQLLSGLLERVRDRAR